MAALSSVNASSSPFDRAHRLTDIIRWTGQFGAMQDGWGQEFAKLLELLAHHTGFEGQGVGRLEVALRVKPQAKTMLLTGERCSGLRPDGSDSPLIQGVIRTAELLYPHATKVPGLARNGREPDALAIVFSGGQMLTRSTGELPGYEMLEQFNRLTNGRFNSYGQADNMSLNTGDQGNVLGGLAWGRNVERLVIVHVVDHLPRFAATVLEGWRACRDGRLADAERGLRSGLVAQEKFDALANRAYPELHLIPVGSWEELEPLRGKGFDGEFITRAQEAFGPVQGDGDIVIPGKKLGGEFAANRWGAECLDGRMNDTIGYACRALKPSQLLRLLDLEPGQRIINFDENAT